MSDNHKPVAASTGKTTTSSWGCVLIAAVLGAALVASALIISGAFRDIGLGIGKTIEQANPINAIATALPPPTPTIVVRPPAIRQVRAVADLTTVSALLSTVVEAEQPR